MYGVGPARAAVVALQARRGRLRRHQRPAQPLRRPRAHAARPDHARGRARPRRSSPSARSRCPGAGHYGRGAPGDPTGEVTNEDYAGMLCEFANGVRGSFEASRTIVGPGERRWPSTCTARAGAAGWNLEKLNELQLYRLTDDPGCGLHDGLRRRALPLPRALRPRQRERDRLRGPGGDRGLRVLRAIAEERPSRPGFEDARELGERAGGAAAVRRDRALGAGDSLRED